jgi:NADH:ubiquinone oxidoreductase subunit F (NADH-binding)
MVVEELKAIQERDGYVSDKALHELSDRINVPVYELHGVASFYPHFRLKPPPKAVVHVCQDIACHLRGCQSLKARIEQLAENYKDVEVKGVSCLGQCDRAPAVLIGGGGGEAGPHESPYRGLAGSEILSLAKTAMEGRQPDHQHIPKLKGPFRCDPYADESERYGALKKLVQSGDYEGVLKALAAGNLRGMGGALFPTARKWETVRKEKSPEKYIICNADECEVGTIKDRELMKNLPYLLVEAMAIAGLVCGAEKGYIYIRHEYHDQIEILEKEIAKAAGMGVIGENVLGSGKRFNLEVFVSPGGYVQGEETALMEAIEGKRGQPRNKIVDVGLFRAAPVFNGLWGKPTVVNNVETLSYVPVILLKGAEWWKGQGINGCEGLKWIGVSGDVNNPGVFEVSMGTSYKEAIYGLAGGIKGGRELKAFCPSGPLAGMLPGSMVDLTMDPKTSVQNVTTLGSGAIVAIAEPACVVDLALNLTRFYRNESCGKCVPCRTGSQKIVDIIYGVTQGSGGATDLNEIERLSETMMMASICGLGQVVHRPIESVLRHFREEVEAHIKHRRCPSGVCFNDRKVAAAVAAAEAGGNGNVRA